MRTLPFVRRYQMTGKVQKPCKICGKPFTPCADCENDQTMFRWRRVACSPECAKEYFARVVSTRNPRFENTEAHAAKAETLLSE